MTRLVLSFCAILFIVSSYAQSPSRTGRWLQRHHMELSMAVMAGASYFEYDTKAIEPHFATPEISLDLLLSKRIAEHIWIQGGIVGSYKGTREPSYDYTSGTVLMEDWIYGLYDLDRTVSSSAHWSWVLPLKAQYYPGKLGLSAGAFFRHFSGLYTSGYHWDFLAGRFDGGVLAGASLPLGNFRFGVDYYHGLVNIKPNGYYITSGGPGPAEYKIFNRSAQVSLRYTFFQDHDEAPPTPWRR